MLIDPKQTPDEPGNDPAGPTGFPPGETPEPRLRNVAMVVVVVLALIILTAVAFA
jgi:hypothetical protein